MFKPKYTITNRLLANIKRINTLVVELNHKRFLHVVLVDLERAAREISSHASTSIEGNPLPLTEVKKILKSTPAHIRDSEREVLNYNQALQDLDKLIKGDRETLTLRSLLGIQKQVTAGLLPDFESGHLRQKPVVVNDPRERKIVYLPPDTNDVSKLLSDLLAFTADNQDIIDPLILAGLFHKEMVIIHPFMDGNGRTARLATKFLLAQMGLDTFNLFSFENYYNKNVTKYFLTVGELGDYYEIADQIDFTPWLEYFTEGIIDELLRVQKTLSEIPHHALNTLSQHQVKILEYLQNNESITDRQYSQITKRAKATRTQDFKKLLELGLLRRKGKGKNTYYEIYKL
jgi:Fic family protein